MGALDHRSDDHPFCPTDRSTATHRIDLFLPIYIAINVYLLDLGGEKDFAELIKAARDRGIKIVVDSTSKLGARKSHRKYNGYLCYSQDKKGFLNPTVGNDR